MSVIFPPVFMSGAAVEASSFTYRTFLNSATSTTNHSFSSVAIGTAPIAPNRRWVVCLFPNSRTFSNISIGGNTGSVIYTTNVTAPSGLVLYWRAIAAEVPSGTTATISFTLNTAAFVQGYVYTLINCDGLSPSATVRSAGTGSAALSINCPANGIVLAMGNAGSSGSSTFTAVPFANLTTQNQFSTTGITTAARRFTTVQTGLNITYDPTSTGTMAFTSAMGLAFPPI